jgi:cytochrome d ubiquinol oxidase subunit II
LLTKSDTDRRIVINSIGPVWDGNEVWLVTAGGALFAAFPDVYATVFSGFYTAFMLLLFVLIFRAVSIEFRSKLQSKHWRTAWDMSFSLSSIVIALLMGVALGNIISGIPVSQVKEFSGSFLSLLNPYSILVGVTSVSLFMMHGAIYLVMKTEDELQKKVRAWVNNTIIFFVICFVTTTMATLIYYPHMVSHFKSNPLFFIFAIMNMLAIANIPREIQHGNEFKAFLSSSASIALLMLLFAIGIFPNLVLSNPNPENSLNIYNAASSQKTLTIMIIIAIIGIPFVLAYTFIIYKVFKGKVKIDETSY